MFDARGAVQSQIRVAVHCEELLEHVEHSRHLREDEHSMTARLQLHEELVEGLQLSAIELDEASIGKLGLLAKCYPRQKVDLWLKLLPQLGFGLFPAVDEMRGRM